MRRGLLLSLIIHGILGAALITSQELELLIKKTLHLKREQAGVIRVDLTYKATETPMRLGEQKKDLPPPKVVEAPKPPAPSKALPKNTKAPKPTAKSASKDSKKKSKAKPSKKPDTRSILDRIRAEAETETRPRPKDDNFPISKDGERGARGTGGSALRKASPAEQALQSAMRRHFELSEASQIRKRFPNAIGFLSLTLGDAGDRFRIVDLSTLQSTGFAMLDQQCEFAARKAIDQESFAPDVISELSKKETLIECRP